MYLYLLNHCQHLREPQAAARAPHPTLQTGGDPLPHPKLRGAHPNTNPGNADIASLQQTPPQLPFNAIFVPFPRFKGQAVGGRLISPVPPRTDYTGCGFQFYIVWPFLALITLIN